MADQTPQELMKQGYQGTPEHSDVASPDPATGDTVRRKPGIDTQRPNNPFASRRGRNGLDAHNIDRNPKHKAGPAAPNTHG